MKRRKGRGPAWTAEAEADLIKMYSKTKMKDLVEYFGKPHLYSALRGTTSQHKNYTWRYA